MKYSYKAYNESGSEVSGTLEASTMDEANAKLLSQGMIPLKVTKGGLNEASLDSLSVRLTKVKPQELILFTKQFRTLFKAGISVLNAFNTLEQQSENPKLKKITQDMIQDIKQGSSLYDCFAKHPHTFNTLYVSMIRAGEVSGALAEVMNRLVSLLEHEFKIKNDINSALQYPKLVVGALGIAFFVLLTFVIPKFASIFQSAGLDLPLPTKMAMGLYAFISKFWYICLAAVILTIFSFKMAMRTEQGRYVRDLVFLKIPIIGPVFQKAAMSRFASIFAILQSSGVSVLDALDILSGTIGNTAIAREFDKIKDKLKQGRGISAPLESARFFTPMVVNMVAIGEESGNLDEMLNEISEHYDDEVGYAVSRMATNLGPVLIVGLAGVVGFFALAIFLPMWDLTKMAG